MLVIHCQTFTMFYVGKTHKTGVHKPFCLFASIDHVHITIYGVIMSPDQKTLKACH